MAALPIASHAETLLAIRGADFPTEGGRYNVFHFDHALRGGNDYAFQVRREDFDTLLFAHARDAGVDARENTKVTRVEFGDDGRPSRVHASGRRTASAPVSPRGRQNPAASASRSWRCVSCRPVSGSRSRRSSSDPG